MSTHLRSQIRHALASYLTGLATTEGRVYRSRRRPLAAGELPCLLVFLDDEEIAPLTVHTNVLLERKPELKLVACAKESDDLDDVLDQILLEVETAMATAPDPTFGGLIEAVALPASIRIGRDDSLDKPAGIAEITYSINYYTHAASPASPV